MQTEYDMANMDKPRVMEPLGVGPERLDDRADLDPREVGTFLRLATGSAQAREDEARLRDLCDCESPARR